MTARNIELKARLDGLDQARRIAAALENRGKATEHQIDIYFHCRDGRLKLRRREGLAAQLIAYRRADRAEAKPSDYQILEVADADLCQSLLESALGILCVVDKQREIFLHDHVRIHLDQVRGLGDFLEFEAVLSPGITEEGARMQVEELSSQFGLGSNEWISVSYSDLVLGNLSRQKPAN